MVNSIFNPNQTYLENYIGSFGTFSELSLPSFLWMGTFLFLVIFSLMQEKPAAFNLRRRLIVCGAVFFSLALLLLSQHLLWDAVGKGIVEQLQGRYLIPLFPLVFILFSNNMGFKKTDLKLFALYILFINVTGLLLLFKRYWYEPAHTTLVLTCDAEATNADGSFKTSHPAFSMQNSGNQTTRAHRSGKQSAVISAGNPYCFACDFKNINTGDLIEVELWKNGKEGQIVISGGGDKCAGFYYPNNWITYADRNGWNYMHLMYRVTESCEHGRLSFMMFNPEPGVVCIDDIRLVLKQWKD
jgi:hypothetical protein